MNEFNRKGKGFLLAVLVMTQTSLPVAASAFTQPASVVAGGGGSSSSASFSNLAVIGQPGIAGNTTSASYKADHGFLPVLGGWRLLYPVISATPGIITFTLAPGAASNQLLAIANTGGSTLNWSVAKSGVGNWLSFNPATGSGTASVTVTADAAGLSAGSYNGVLTVSGAGISETVEVQINLTVAAGNIYRLTLTVKSDTAGKGGGLVYNTASGISCSNTGSDPGTQDGTCQADFLSGTVLTLTQSPDSNSTYAVWSHPGCVTGQSCQVVMDGAKNVTATFPYAYLARVSSSGISYDTLTEALSNAAATDTILARDVTFTGDLNLINKIITLTGGLSAWYLPQNAWTTLSNGRLIIQSGQLTVDRLTIK
jgi:hypothetical protein